MLNADTNADVYEDPRQEVLYRLRYLKGGFAFRRLEQLFGDIRR